MSMPSIPDLKPQIDITRESSVDIILASIGMEELSLSHILNAEAEKIQYALGTLKIGEDENGNPIYSESLTSEDVAAMNKSAGKMLRDVIKNQMLLGMKMEDVVEIATTVSETTTDDTTTP